MATSATSAETFKFKDVTLHGVLMTWSASGGMRIANHEYIKRNGGETEPQGARQDAFTFRCVLMGEDCGKRLQTIISNFKAEPRGDLIHPRMGRKKACWESWEANEDPTAACDQIEFSLTFREDNADQAVSEASRPTVQERAALAQGASDDLLAANALKYVDVVATAITVSTALAQALARRVSAFIFAATEAAQTQVLDPGLEDLLGRVGSARDVYLASLPAIIAFTLEPDIALTPLRTQSYLCAAYCIELYLAVKALAPPVVPFPVPAPLSMRSVSVLLYGPLGRARLPMLQQLNPGLRFPHCLPTGTVLNVLAPLPIQ